MAPRPRKPGSPKIANLYAKLDKRTDRVYYSYKDQRTGRFHGLGTDRALAEQRTKILNAAIADQIVDRKVQAILKTEKGDGIKVREWIATYLDIQAEKLADGEIAKHTANSRRWRCNAVLDRYGDLPLISLDTERIAELLKEYAKAKKGRMAQAIHAALIDVFDEAIAAGKFPSDKPNPARVAKRPKHKTKRARLTLETWQPIFKAAQEHCPPWGWKAMLLALVTGQRLDDVANMQFKDEKTIDGRKYLEVVQSKTGARVRIDTALRLDAVGYSVREVIALCRDRVASPWMNHHSVSNGTAQAGQKVRAKTLSDMFRLAREHSGLTWGEDPAPPFHEIRSLSKRLYDAQGVDTKALLGHKTDQIAAEYADARGFDWVTVKA